MAAEPAEVIAAPVPFPAGSTPSGKGTKMLPKPISEQAFAMSVERKQDDRTSKSTEVGRQLVTELRATGDSRLIEANPPPAVSGGVDGEAEAEAEVEKEAVVTSVQVCHIDENTACSRLTRNSHLGLT